MIAIIKEREKADSFQKKFGGKIFSGYRSLLESEEIDAVYLPLPPALHCEWGIRALEHGKHLLVEKPSSTTSVDTARLVEAASTSGLALHENYMFQYHSQLEKIRGLIASGELGEIRTYRLSFGFPHRGMDDFYIHCAPPLKTGFMTIIAQGISESVEILVFREFFQPFGHTGEAGLF